MKNSGLSLLSVALILLLSAAASSQTKLGDLKTELKRDDIGAVVDPKAATVAPATGAGTVAPAGSTGGVPAADSAPADGTPTLDKPLRADSVIEGGVRPIKGYPVTSEYGPRKLFGNFHHGIDIGCPTGTPALAIWDGTVVKTAYETGGGRYVDIKYDNGLVSRYYHLKSVNVKKGQKVKAGQKVALTDNTGTWTTGAHLHFEICQAGKKINPRTVLKF